MRKPQPEILRLLVFVGSLIAVLVVLIVFRRIFLPLLLGLGIAYIFDPAVTWFERHGRSRLFGIIVLTIALALALAGIVGYVVPTISDQARHLGERLPEYTNRLEKNVAPLVDRLQARYPEEMAELQARITASVKDNLPEIARSVSRGVKRIFSNLFGFILFLLNLIFVPVFAFYLLMDLPRMKRSVAELIPVPYREAVLARVREVDEAVSSFLRGQLTIAVILAVINATGLMIIGVPLGLLIGVIAGLANMIPYMALVVGLAPALLLCWAEYQSFARLIAVVAVFSGAQLLEGTVLSPRILGKSINLHPVWVLLAIIAGGSLFGFIGMLVAVPVAAAIKVFAHHWVAAYKSSSVYRARRLVTDDEEEAEPAQT